MPYIAQADMRASAEPDLHVEGFSISIYGAPGLFALLFLGKND